MTQLFVICVSLFIVCLVIMIICYFTDLLEEIFPTSLILLMVSGIGMIVSAAHIKPDVKAKEYPASEYDFKIKVVEFEEKRDTILVVIPKEK